MTATPVEQHRFEAEVDQVLSIVVNSLYSHREVFLRELISNASDALDKLAFRALTEKELLGTDAELRIEIVPDRAARTLTIRDNGVGMTHDELIQHLGTIARSGSRQLVESLKAKGDGGDDLKLIGQFGVGFYSAFLVADRVRVVSRAAGADTAFAWESDAKHGYTVEPGERDGRGTDVVLHLKEDADEFLQRWEIEKLVRKYSDYVRHPIRLLVERQEPIVDEDGEPEKDAEGKTRTHTVTDWSAVNQASALWTRPRAEVTDGQYVEFYKHLSHDWSDPLAWTHFKVEGTQELTGLLFLPETPPFDLFDQRRQHGVRLFVRRVFIMEDCEELLPEWLRFVRGIVDSEDLPLNVSREILQQDRATRAIRKQVVKRTLTLLQELADEGDTPLPERDGEDGDGSDSGGDSGGDSGDTGSDGGEPRTRNRYAIFWRAFGRVLKEGFHFAPEHRDELAQLVRYESSKGAALRSLADYVADLQPDQPGIYYVTGDSLAACRNSPHLEGLLARGYEVLFMPDPIDEWVVQSLTEYADKQLIDVQKGALDLPESDAQREHKEQRAKDLEGLTGAIKQALAERVEDVRVTDRLTDSPACLVTQDRGLSPHLERLLRANGQDVPAQKRILELNPDHPVVQALGRMTGDAGRAADVARWSSVLYDQALLAEGTLPADPAAFARAVADLMRAAVGAD
ncbi:MAG: molecular chaperone HtpG [Planctomycetes bacterium]|nr:molecular chaperone HtpG [Planctomycetota bacterium]